MTIQKLEDQARAILMGIDNADVVEQPQAVIGQNQRDVENEIDTANGVQQSGESVLSQNGGNISQPQDRECNLIFNFSLFYFLRTLISKFF